MDELKEYITNCSLSVGDRFMFSKKIIEDMEKACDKLINEYLTEISQCLFEEDKYKLMVCIAWVIRFKSVAQHYYGAILCPQSFFVDKMYDDIKKYTNLI